MVCIYYRVGNGNRNRILGMVNRCTNHCAIPTNVQVERLELSPPDWKSGVLNPLTPHLHNGEFYDTLLNELLR